MSTKPRTIDEPDDDDERRDPTYGLAKELWETGDPVEALDRWRDQEGGE